MLHVQKLAELYFTQDARFTLVTIIEGDANWTLCNSVACEIGTYLEKFSPASPPALHLMNVDKERDCTYYGVHTSAPAKETMVTTANMYMSLRKVSIDADFFTAYPKKSKGVLEVLAKELGQMRRIQNPVTFKEKISGKGDNNLHNDDTAMAFLIGLYWSRRHLVDKYPAMMFSAGHKHALAMGV
jgi:hypothetical protein